VAGFCEHDNEPLGTIKKAGETWAIMNKDKDEEQLEEIKFLWLVKGCTSMNKMKNEDTGAGLNIYIN
jgi:hypothetical protein